MTIYDEFAAMVTELLQPPPAGYGKRVVLRDSNVIADPTALEEVPDAPVDLPTIGAYPSMMQRYIRESLVTGAARVLVIDASVEPKMQHKVVDGADLVPIVKIDTINPAGTPIAYFLQLER